MHAYNLEIRSTQYLSSAVAQLNIDMHFSFLTQTFVTVNQELKLTYCHATRAFSLADQILLANNELNIHKTPSFS